MNSFILGKNCHSPIYSLLPDLTHSPCFFQTSSLSSFKPWLFLLSLPWKIPSWKIPALCSYPFLLLKNIKQLWLWTSAGPEHSMQSLALLPGPSSTFWGPQSADRSPSERLNSRHLIWSSFLIWDYGASLGFQYNALLFWFPRFFRVCVEYLKGPDAFQLTVVVQLLSHASSLWSHVLQHSSLPCSSLSPRICSNSCPLCQCCP